MTTSGGGPGPDDQFPTRARRVGPYEQSLRESEERAEQAHEAKAHRRRVLLGAGVVVAIAAAAFGGWRLLAPASPPTTVSATGAVPVSCSNPTPVSVAAAPAIAPILSKVTEALSQEDDGPCATYTIASAESYGVAGQVGAIGGPDAWVTDSLEWVERAQVFLGRDLAVATPFASTGVVVALPKASADALGDKASWASVLGGNVPVRVPDPNRSTLGAAALGSVTPALAPTAIPGLVGRTTGSAHPDLAATAASKTPLGVVVPAAQLVAYNEASPGQTLTGLAPAGGTPFLSYSLATVSDDQKVAGLVADLGKHLASSDAKELLAGAGFTTPDGPDPQLPTPLLGTITGKDAPAAASLQAIHTQWRAAMPRIQALLALDVSGSMLSRTKSGTRLSSLQSATLSVAGNMPPLSTLSLWAYSENIGAKGDDFQVLLKHGPIGDSKQFADFRKHVDGLTRSVGGGTGLYDTIAAAYQSARVSFAPGIVNKVVIVTDGPNDDQYGASLATLTAKLKQLQNPATPVRIDIVGIGKEPDAKALTSIAQLTGGVYIPALETADLPDALIQMLGG